MQSLFENFSLILTTPPGNLAYYLVLTFSVVGAFQGALTATSPDAAPRRRMLAGLFLLLLTQLALFVAAGFAWQGALPSVTALPVVDRSAALLSAVLFVWLWAFPLPKRFGDVSVIGIAAGVVGGLIWAGLWWNDQTVDTAFNASQADMVLNAIAVGVLVIGVLVLLFRRPLNWGLGLAMLLLLALGHSMSLLFAIPFGDYSGWLRLTQLAAYPWLLALPRSLENVLTHTPSAPIAPSIVPDRKRFNLQPALVQELLVILRNPANPDFAHSLVRIIGQIMLADYCMLLVPSSQENQIVIAQVYNLIEEKYMEGFSIDSRLLPGIDSALRRGRILRLPSGSTSADLTVLAQRMHLGRVGHLMLVPIAVTGNEPRMAVLVLSPYSNRSWAADDQVFLGQVSESIAAILTARSPVPLQHDEILETVQFPAGFDPTAAELDTQTKALQALVEELRQQVTEERSRAESLAALVESQRENAQISAGPDEDFVTAKELQAALYQVADLRKALAEADRKLQSIEPASMNASTISSQDREEIINLVEELRQPLASVIGNADMLMGESMGILGAYQKKFVERIRSGGDRMSVLFDDLVQLVNMAGSAEVLVPQSIDLNAIIDNAIEVAMVPLRNKNLTLRVEIPAGLPAFRADPQSVQRILTNLLQNAGTCTPADGEVTLQARAETPEHEPGFILIQISDSGGGIAPQDLPRIFSQTLKPDSAVIEGLGNPPESFSTTKALVEAHGGRLWVDSVAGRGAVFSALFPIENEGLSVR